MAEDHGQKTEEASPRRKEKAREDGQVASSKELTTALQFGAAVAMLTAFGPTLFAGLDQMARGLFQEAFYPDLAVERLMSVAAALALDPLSFLGVFALTLLGIGFLMHFAQTGFLLAPKKLAPDFNRLNPASKLKEMPTENLGQLFKGLLLLPLAGVVFWQVLSSELPGFLQLPRAGVNSSAEKVGDSILSLLAKAALVLIALGVFDLVRQRQRISKRLMMTKQEMRQEQKDAEGNPQIKARLRRLQRDLGRRRMMADVPNATVVITNPTHYAVAIKYEPETMAAPLVLAKGLDHLALRMRAVAEEHGIAIVENPPLAQALHKAADVGSEIPMTLYRAVAEVLAYIYRLRNQTP